MIYPVGTRFIRQGRKHARTETVVDMLTTHNIAGETVKVRYVSQHEFMGQTVTDHDVVPTTIARGIIND